MLRFVSRLLNQDWIGLEAPTSNSLDMHMVDILKLLQNKLKLETVADGISLLATEYLIILPSDLEHPEQPRP